MRSMVNNEGVEIGRLACSVWRHLVREGATVLQERGKTESDQIEQLGLYALAYVICKANMIIDAWEVGLYGVVTCMDSPAPRPAIVRWMLQNPRIIVLLLLLHLHVHVQTAWPWSTLFDSHPSDSVPNRLSQTLCCILVTFTSLSSSLFRALAN